MAVKLFSTGKPVKRRIDEKPSVDQRIAQLRRELNKGANKKDQFWGNIARDIKAKGL